MDICHQVLYSDWRDFWLRALVLPKGSGKRVHLDDDKRMQKEGISREYKMVQDSVDTRRKPRGVFVVAHVRYHMQRFLFSELNKFHGRPL